MKESEGEANEERKKLGYEPVSLVGWASPPHYDSQTKKLYWAKESKFGNEEKNTLNYNVRILGRKGVLVMNAVSGMEQLPGVQKGMKKVIAFAEFTKGNKYSDFDSGVDKVATCGIGAYWRNSRRKGGIVCQARRPTFGIQESHHRGYSGNRRVSGQALQAP